MVVETTLPMEQSWRLLWEHAAYQVVTSLPSDPALECASAGYGWGLRNATNSRQALLIHPSAHGREIGDLSLTVLGHGTQVIPRCNYSYTKYLNAVADVVETVAQAYLLD